MNKFHSTPKIILFFILALSLNISRVPAATDRSVPTTAKPAPKVRVPTAKKTSDAPMTVGQQLPFVIRSCQDIYKYRRERLDDIKDILSKVTHDLSTNNNSADSCPTGAAGLSCGGIKLFNGQTWGRNGFCDLGQIMTAQGIPPEDQKDPDIRKMFSTISRIHFVIKCENNEFVLHDFSKNGTLIYGRKDSLEEDSPDQEDDLGQEDDPSHKDSSDQVVLLKQNQNNDLVLKDGYTIALKLQGGRIAEFPCTSTGGSSTNISSSKSTGKNPDKSSLSTNSPLLSNYYASDLNVITNNTTNINLSYFSEPLRKNQTQVITTLTQSGAKKNDKEKLKKSGHTVLITSSNDDPNTKKFFKYNKHDRPILSVLEVAMADLYSTALGKRSSHMSLVFDEKGVLGTVAQDLSTKDEKFIGMEKFSSSVPPDKFIQELIPLGLADILTSSYFFEEDDLHKGNWGIIQRDQKNIGLARLDYDMSLFNIVKEHQNVLLRTLTFQIPKFTISKENLCKFPNLSAKDHGWYSPSIHHPASGWLHDPRHYTKKETLAYQSLQNNQAFIKEKWKSFLKLAITPNSLTDRALEQHTPTDLVMSGVSSTEAEKENKKLMDSLEKIKKEINTRRENLADSLVQIDDFCDFLLSNDGKNATSLKESIKSELFTRWQEWGSQSGKYLNDAMTIYKSIESKCSNRSKTATNTSAGSFRCSPK